MTQPHLTADVSNEGIAIVRARLFVSFCGRSDFTVMAAGGFDPLHIGHTRHLKMAKELAGPSGKLLVVTHTDEGMRRKKAYCFMPLEQRVELLMELRCVDAVLVAEQFGDLDGTVTKTLKTVRPHVYAKGGDRTAANIPPGQAEVANRLGIWYVFGLGDKVESSERLVARGAVNLLRALCNAPTWNNIMANIEAENVAKRVEQEIPKMGVS